jgi:phage gpG-like protein
MITLIVQQDDLEKEISQLLASLKGGFGHNADTIATLLENSVRRNFREGGRPEKWQQSNRAKKESGQTLVDTGRLANSFTSEGTPREIRVGTNVKYGPAHHFGVDKEITQQVRDHVRRISKAFGKDIPVTEVRVKPHSRTFHLQIEPRPFMLIQDEDWLDIGDILAADIDSHLGGRK